MARVTTAHKRGGRSSHARLALWLHKLLQSCSLHNNNKVVLLFLVRIRATSPLLLYQDGIVHCSIVLCCIRVTVVGLCVCPSVCLSTTILALQATRRLMSDTNQLQCYKGMTNNVAILLKRLRSRDMS